MSEVTPPPAGSAAEPWLTVVSREAFGYYCGECGQPFRKGSKAQRIEGGYGYRCEAHRD